MKIAVKDLEPNPFRKMGQYPIDREKVEQLKTSIHETSFWDNILARKTDGHIQIAYGHHRLIALKELKIKEVDIPIRKIDDARMIQIMANENLGWNTSPAVINETILITKEFLDSELAKADYVTSNSSIRCLFGSKTAYTETKTKGVGQTTILKFLGKNWKQWMVKEALETLKDKNVDREAVEILPTMYQGRKFRKAVKDYKIPKANQKKIAKKIVEDGVGSRDIPKTVRKHKTVKIDKDPVVAKLEKTYDQIDDLSRTLTTKIKWFRKELEELNVKQLKGVKTFLVLTSLHSLMKTIKEFFGMGETKQIEGKVK